MNVNYLYLLHSNNKYVIRFILGLKISESKCNVKNIRYTFCGQIQGTKKSNHWKNDQARVTTKHVCLSALDENRRPLRNLVPVTWDLAVAVNFLYLISDQERSKEVIWLHRELAFFLACCTCILILETTTEVYKVYIV